MASPAGGEISNHNLSRDKWRWLFALLVFCEALLAAGLAVGKRIPDGHDGLQYFMYQYYFLNNSMQSGQVAQWIPYMTQGTTANLWYAFNASMIQAVAIHTGRLIAWMQPLQIFYFGLFIDQLMLLAGLWLWCRRFCKHEQAVCFISIAVVGSTLWVDQPSFNLHFYYAVPMILHLGHRFLELGRWRYAAAAGNLLALQTLGNAAYAITVTTFVIAVYFALSFIFGRRGSAERWARVHFGWPALGTALITALSLLGAYKMLAMGLDQVVSIAPQRNLDGSVTLGEFLGSVANTSYSQWKELVVRIPGMIDYTLYCGVLTPSLALYGLLQIRRDQFHLVILGILLFLLAQGNSPVVSAVYHIWPGMKFYRHLSSINVFVKLILCVLAGIGFDHFFFPFKSPALASSGWPRAKKAAALMTILFFIQLFWLVTLAQHADALSALTDEMISEAHTSNVLAIRSLLDSLRPWISAYITGAAALICVVRFFVGGSPHMVRLTAGIAILVALADLYEFKTDYLLFRTDSAAQVPDLVRTQPMTFARQRTSSADLSIGRGGMLSGVVHFSYARYNCINAFSFIDEVGSSFRCDSWLRPLDRLLRTYWGQPLDVAGVPPFGLSKPGGVFDPSTNTLQFPLRASSAKKVTGMEPGKYNFLVTHWNYPLRKRFRYAWVARIFPGMSSFCNPWGRRR